MEFSATGLYMQSFRPTTCFSLFSAGFTASPRIFAASSPVMRSHGSMSFDACGRTAAFSPAVSAFSGALPLQPGNSRSAQTGTMRTRCFVRMWLVLFRIRFFCGNTTFQEKKLRMIFVSLQHSERQYIRLESS
jgi:hypothetical protein